MDLTSKKVEVKSYKLEAKITRELIEDLKNQSGMDFEKLFQEEEARIRSERRRKIISEIPNDEEK